jgi:hypothetical protein
MGIGMSVLLIGHPIPMIVMCFVAVGVGLVSEVGVGMLVGVLLWLHLGVRGEGI